MANFTTGVPAYMCTVERILTEQLKANLPQIAPVSIALGVLEQCFTVEQAKTDASSLRDPTKLQARPVYQPHKGAVVTVHSDLLPARSLLALRCWHLPCSVHSRKHAWLALCCTLCTGHITPHAVMMSVLYRRRFCSCSEDSTLSCRSWPVGLPSSLCTRPE